MGAGSSVGGIRTGCDTILNNDVCNDIFKGAEKLQKTLQSKGLYIPMPKPSMFGAPGTLYDWVKEMESFIEKNSNALDFLNKLKSDPNYAAILAKVYASNKFLQQNPKLAGIIAKIIIYGQTTGGDESFKEVIGAGVGAMVCMDITNVMLVIIILILTYMIIKELGYIEAYIPSNEENMTPYRPLITS